jgi:hypothetical protein
LAKLNCANPKSGERSRKLPPEFPHLPTEINAITEAIKSIEQAAARERQLGGVDLGETFAKGRATDRIGAFAGAMALENDA